MNLKQLREIWNRSGFRCKKSLGQNFLIDNNIKENILDALPLQGDSTVVEIGPGFGVMSFSLADRCTRLYALEKDKKICDIVKPSFDEKKNITLVNTDALLADLCDLTGGKRDIIVFGNIPYYISTPLIIRMIEQRGHVSSVYIVIQEELADRIVAPPGSRTYGSISCFVQFYTAAKKLFKIKKNSFYPRPGVESCLLELVMLESPSVRVKDEALMFSIIRKGFSERRKKIINPLSGKGFILAGREEWIRVFDACGIDFSCRAEELGLKDYAKLVDMVLSVAKKKDRRKSG